jgi:hypothetical protein
MSNESIVWQRIVRHEGDMFTQLRGRDFTYAIEGNALRPSTTNRLLGRSQFAKGIDRMPARATSDLHDLQGPSYLFAILMDDRIRSGLW